MHVPALRNAAPIGGIVRQHVTLDDGDVLEVIGKHSGGEQTAYARPQHDRALPQFCHGLMLSQP